jgi:hypothetical protein
VQASAISLAGPSPGNIEAEVFESRWWWRFPPDANFAFDYFK